MPTHLPSYRSDYKATTFHRDHPRTDSELSRPTSVHWTAQSVCPPMWSYWQLPSSTPSREKLKPAESLFQTKFWKPLQLQHLLLNTDRRPATWRSQHHVLHICLVMLEDRHGFQKCWAFATLDLELELWELNTFVNPASLRTFLFLTVSNSLNLLHFC